MALPAPLPAGSEQEICVWFVTIATLPQELPPTDAVTAPADRPSVVQGKSEDLRAARG